MLQCLRHIYQYVHAANKDVHGLPAKENKERLTQRHRQPSAAARPSADIIQAFNPHDKTASKFDTLHCIHSLRSPFCACAHPLLKRFVPDTCQVKFTLYMSFEKLLYS
jgi:hypothetical protein